MAERSKNAPVYRDRLMRQIAALHAQLARGLYKDTRAPITDTEHQKLLEQIATLEKQLMAP